MCGSIKANMKTFECIAKSGNTGKEIARCLLPDIVACFESEQGQRDFAEWKAQQESAKKEKSEVA